MGNQNGKKRPYFNRCNGGDNQGFGQMYVDEKQFKFTEINEPRKRRPPFRLLFILVLNGWLLWQLYFVYTYKKSRKRRQTKNQKDRYQDLLIIYIIYLFLLMLLDYFKEQTTSIKPYSGYEKVFTQIAEANCSATFSVTCYHYEGTGKNRHKVNTHSAKRSYLFETVRDNSGEVKKIESSSRFVLVKYIKRFSFGDKQTKGHFIRNFNIFAGSNARDKYQTFEYSIQIPRLQPFVCYCNGKILPITLLYYFFAVIGLAAPFLLIMEFMVERYEVTVHKILNN